VWQPYKKECEWKQDRHKIVKTPRCLLEIYLLMEGHEEKNVRVKLCINLSIDKFENKFSVLIYA